MTDVSIVYSPLSSFNDINYQVDLELFCLSHMSIKFFFSRHQNSPSPIECHFVPFQFRKEDIDEQKYKHVILAFHFCKTTEKTHLIQLLSSECVNFIQVYNMLYGTIFGSAIFQHYIC